MTELKRYELGGECYDEQHCGYSMRECEGGDWVRYSDIEPLIRDAMRAKSVGDAVDEVLAVYNSGGRMNIQWAMELLAGAMQEQSK